ncbi:uncharacterized protein [Primulina eburnea]|uniref:uncharacterized protein isoform X1 n=1 Tax=Primulina eburnea TaxID=1245227 RepID=UPI003C6BF30F
MQCTSYVPVYYLAKDRNVCANGFSWHLFNGDHNYVEGQGAKVLLPSYTLEQYLGYDKDVLRQIIQNHDATFRFQVGELHRLYIKQRELMDEIKTRGIFAQLQLQKLESNCPLSPSRSSCCQTLLPHATSCLIEDSQGGKMPFLSAENVQKRPFFVAGKFQETTTVSSSPFLTKANFNGIEATPFRSKIHDIQILDLEIPAYLCHDSGREQVEEESFSARRVISDIHPPKKTSYLIDLNKPAFLGPMTSSSSAPSEPCGDNIVNGNSSFSGEETKPELVLYKHCRLVNCQGSSAEKTSSWDIDLNSTPLSCISETEITFESIENINEEIKVGDSENAGIISFNKMNLKACASTEIDISSSEGISKDIQIEAPLFSKQVEGESVMELDMIGAETLIMISTSRIGQYTKNSSSEPVGNSNKTLYWFADVVASVDQEIEIITTTQSLQVDVHNFYVEKEKETGKIVGSLERDRVNRTKQHKNLRKIGLLERNASKNACATPGKCYKLQHLDVIQKSLDSKLRHQPRTHYKQGFLQKCLDGWGKIRKRQEGHRRRASKFLVIS